METENDIRKIDPTKLARLLQWADDPEALDIEPNQKQPEERAAESTGENLPE